MVTKIVGLLSAALETVRAVFSVGFLAMDLIGGSTHAYTKIAIGWRWRPEIFLFCRVGARKP